MASGGDLSRNWRSALVVNGLFDALEETERQRDELAQNLSKSDAGPPLFDAYEGGGHGDGDDDWPPPRGRDSRSGDDQPGDYYHHDVSSRTRELRRRTPPPPLLRHSLLTSSSLPPPPTAATTAVEATQHTRSAGNMDENDRHSGVFADGEGQQQQPERKGAGSRKSQQMPPPPRRNGGGASSFRDIRRGSRGDGRGERADAGVRTGGRGEEEEKAGLGLSAASIGSVAGELRGGELERVRGRVADLGAAIETSQSKLLRELSQVQEDFFSSFGYTPPLGASAATSAATSAGPPNANFGSGGGGGGGGHFSSAISSIPPLGTGSGGGGGASLHASAYKDRSRSPRWGGAGSGSGGGGGGRTGNGRKTTASVSPRARSPLRRRDLDGTVAGGEERRGDEARGDSYFHRVGTRPSGGRSGVRGRTGGVGSRKDEAVAATTGAATADGALYAFPVTASSSPRAEGGGAGGREGGFVTFSAASSPRVPGRTWRSLSPSPRAAVAGRPTGAIGSARRSYVRSAGVDELRERLLAELEGKGELERELEDSRREAEECREREELRDRETEELAEKEAMEREGRVEAEVELQHLRVAHRSLEEKSTLLAGKAEALQQRSSELERRSAQLEEKAAARERDITRRDAELEKLSKELQQRDAELQQRNAELQHKSAELGETRGALGEKSAALEQAICRVEEREARLEEAGERRRELEAERDGCLQELHDLQGVSEEYRTASSERAAAAFLRERGRASLRAAIWQWRVIALKTDLGTAVAMTQSLKLRQAMRGAFGAWLDLSRRRSNARLLLSRLVRRRTEVDQRGALRRWVRQAAAVAAAAASAALEKAEAERTRSSAARVLLKGLARGRRRSMEAGLAGLRGGVTASRTESQALRRLSIGYHRRSLGLASLALSRWRGNALALEKKTAAVRRLIAVRQRQELAGAVRRWGGAVGAERAAEGLARRAERAVRRARVARAVRGWREECSRQRAAESRKAGERCRRVLSGRVELATRRNLLTRCLTAWKAYAVTRRCQLRSARSFLLARNRRAARAALAAWRDGRRGRAEAARRLWALGRAHRTAALREGLRRLGESARGKERQETAMLVSSAKLEADELRQERDAMGARLAEATGEAQRATRHRVRVEKELVRRHLLVLGRECFAAWKGVVQAEQRKKACLLKLVHRNRRCFLRGAFCSWRDGTRGATALAVIERIVTRSARHKLLQTTLRGWSEGTRRRRRFAAVFSRAARVVRSLQKRQQRAAFLVWRAAAESDTKRAADISAACARLRAVRKRPERLQVANAFSVWARLSAASCSSGRRAETALRAKRHKALRACLSALRANAFLRRRARRALASLDHRCRLRRLTRGWGAVLRAAAAGSAERRAVARLGRAEAAVAAGRLAARARAHRTARRLLGVARGRTALEAFVAWRGLVREGRGARLGAAALAGRSKRRRLRDLFVCWRQEALASSQLRSRTLTRISKAAEGLVSDAFSRWRERHRAASGGARVLTSLARVSDRRRSQRAEMRLALKTWRRNACGGGDGDLVDGGGEGGGGGGGGGAGVEEDGLEAVAGVFVEAAAAFSTASSVPRVFELVEEFVPEVAASSRGRVLLLNGEPGGGMFCLESDRHAPSEQDPLEASFPIGNGLVARCVATGLAFQTRHGGNYGGAGGNDAANCGVSSAPSARRRYGNTNAANNSTSSNNMGAIEIALVGPADLHALPLPQSYELESPSSRHGAAAMPSSISFQGQVWKKSQSVAAVSGPESASTVPPPPASWENHGARPSGGGTGSPVLGGGGGGGRGRSRLAFFPANDDGGSSRSPSPAGPVGAGFGGARGYGFLSNSPPPVGGQRDSRRWCSGSESPSPRHRQQPQQQPQQWQRSISPPRARRRGVAMPEEEEGGDEGVVLHVACLPVTGGDGGQAMMGVLKVWRQQHPRRQRGGESNRAPDNSFASGEMAALGVLAGQAAAALRRLGAEAAQKEGVFQELGAAAADRASETQKRDAAAEKEAEDLREAMKHVSESAKGLAKQRDDARAALARAKGTLRRMAPALREVRDRQLGFRHYHDLIVNMSKAVLQDDDNNAGHPGADPEVEEDGGCGCGDTNGGGCGGGGGNNGRQCCRAASVGSHTRNNTGGGSTSRRACSPVGFSPGVSRSRSLHRSCGGGDGGGGGGFGFGFASSSPGPRCANGSRSPSRGHCGFRARASPEGRAAAAVSLARSGTGGGGGPSILAALRETAAAGGADVRARGLSRDRGRPRERYNSSAADREVKR